MNTPSVSDGAAWASTAMLGKTIAALMFVIALILLCSYLLKRVSGQRSFTGHRLRVVAGTAVGPRERVVIIEVENTWLVLGVGGGKVTKLHELPAPPAAVGPIRPEPDAESFASRFSQVLKQNITGSGPDKPASSSR